MSKTKDKKESLLMSKLKPAMIRFVYLYLGSEDGRCFNNATLSYIRAYEIDTVMTKVTDKKGKSDYTPEYKSAKTCAYALLTKPDIMAFRDYVLLEMGFKPETIKKRFAELAYQNKNLIVAQGSTRDMAKLTGMITDDKKVDIPQLEELGNAIRSILTPKK